MTKKISIWGREFDLKVVFDCFDDEEILPIQEQALKSFLKADAAIEDSKKQVESYILNDDYAELETDSIDNIFKYVSRLVLIYLANNPSIAERSCLT